MAEKQNIIKVYKPNRETKKQTVEQQKPKVVNRGKQTKKTTETTEMKGE